MANRTTPDRHPQRDFFVADLSDLAAKDDLGSMEHPLFALKAGDKRVREYLRPGVSVKVMPGAMGMATIHDKDLWIYAISQLVAAQDAGLEISRVVRFTAYNFLTTTNRRTDGDSYKRMADALNRLAGTRIETNIETQGQRERAGFGLIDSWTVIERDDSERMVAVEIELPRWLFRAIQGREVLTISREYFQLRRALDRRIYELARKHCGHQPKWRVTLKTLHEKSGSTASLKDFRRDFRDLVASKALPDYRVDFDEKEDAATFYPRGPKAEQARARDFVKRLKRDAGN